MMDFLSLFSSPPHTPISCSSHHVFIGVVRPARNRPTHTYPLPSLTTTILIVSMCHYYCSFFSICLLVYNISFLPFSILWTRLGITCPACSEVGNHSLAPTCAPFLVRYYHPLSWNLRYLVRDSEMYLGFANLYFYILNGSHPVVTCSGWLLSLSRSGPCWIRNDVSRFFDNSKVCTNPEGLLAYMERVPSGRYLNTLRPVLNSKWRCASSITLKSRPIIMIPSSLFT